ncbi:YkgJ family cysteine cluster protein [Aliiglaciecola sp. LCG003]|uniref:YkgJ family cysteine cluster protein n=1 Tax=Aliiglaciecola sp. LCG003 TaxID=3053655 RepID=UPI002573BE70|nr:YkgJ family cysteine cluster protein [Aliiglaciecola sp. LCG003]WJG10881.1 YkgJ family cysteine cluster protein [Aliiglaciecola sp. LCG003]
MKSCNQCGKCCVKYSDGGLSVTEQEIDMWVLFRPDIVDYVKNGKIWHQPKSGEAITLCPWLRIDAKSKLYTCDIYFDRPDDCKYYPVTIAQMVDDECEMLEDGDLVNVPKAQKALDILMQDSRPPMER